MCCADSEESYEFILAASKKKKKKKASTPGSDKTYLWQCQKKKPWGLLFRVFSKPLYELRKAETNLIRLKCIH